MDETSWLRQCALCGTLDADEAWPAPTEAGAAWRCSRCEAVRFLWQPVAPAQPAAATG